MAKHHLPDSVKSMKGTDQPCRMNGEQLLDSLTEVPEPPDYMVDGFALNSWRERSIELVALGLLPKIDMRYLAMFCQLEGKMFKLWSSGETPTSSQYGQYRGMAAELGLQRMGRTKINISKDTNKKNPFARHGVKR